MNRWSYIIMTYSDSPLKSLSHILFMVPLLILVFVLMTNSVIIPINHLNFLKRSNYQYEYTLSSEAEKENENIFLYSRGSNMIIKSEDSGSTAVSTQIYYLKYGLSLEKSYFTEENLIKGKEIKADKINEFDGSIYLSYEIAKSFKKDVGDTIEIGYYYYTEDLKREYVAKDFILAGFVKPYYDETNLERNTIDYLSLAYITEDLYDWLWTKDVSKVIFSDIEKEDFYNYKIKSVKAEKVEDAKRYIKSLTNIYKMVGGLVFSFLAMASIAIIEFRALRKEHRSKMVLLNLLGYSLKKSRALYRTIASLNMLVALLVSFIFTRAILDKFLYIYVELLPFLGLFLLSLVFLTIVIVLQSKKIKSI